MEARTSTQKTILAIGATQAVLAASLLPAQDFKGVELWHLETYFANGWRLPGSLFFALTSLVMAVLVICNEPRRTPITGLLQCLGEVVFDLKKLDDNVLSHKVTLFMLRPRRNPLGLGAVLRWFTKDKAKLKLVPWSRHPIAARRPSRSFRVDKDDLSLCEGVAGLVFAQGKFVSTINLPRLQSASQQSDIEEFARKTNDKASRVRANHHYDMRSIGGFPLLAPDDASIMGVLMIDSSDPEVVESISSRSSVQGYVKALTRVVNS